MVRVCYCKGRGANSSSTMLYFIKKSENEAGTYGGRKEWWQEIVTGDTGGKFFTECAVRGRYVRENICRRGGRSYVRENICRRGGRSPKLTLNVTMQIIGY